MCVAAVITAPISLQEHVLMEESNPHGGGVGWLDKSVTPHVMRYHKGLTAEDIFNLQEEGKLTYPYLLHYRWATHGPKVAELCHPFPLGVKALYDTPKGEAESILIHNGVWNNYEAWMPSWLPQLVQDNLSDTAVAAYVMETFPDLQEEISWATVVGSVGEDGELSLKYDGGWTDYKGSKFSNLSWLPYTHAEWAPKGCSSDARTYTRGSDYGDWWNTWRGKEWRDWVGEGEKEARGYSAECDDDSRAYTEDLYGTDPDVAYNSFEEFIAAKYGSRVANLAMAIDPAGNLTEEELESLALSNAELVSYRSKPRPDSDTVSEDPEVVNMWLAGQDIMKGD